MKPTFVLITVIGVVLLASIGCRGARRPTGVPDGAVQVPFSKDGGWAYCWLDDEIQMNKCRTYNAGGQRLYRFGHENDDDDVFVNYSGSGLVPESELLIDPVHSGASYIWLQNGVVLIPRNDFENQKELIDEMMRVREQSTGRNTPR